MMRWSLPFILIMQSPDKRLNVLFRSGHWIYDEQPSLIIGTLKIR